MLPNLSSNTTSLNFIRGFSNQTNEITNTGGEVILSYLDPSIDGLSSNNNLANENLRLNSFGACAILSSGLECWGDEYGDSSLIYNQEPVTDMSLSSTNTCFIDSNDSVRCMGENVAGEINSSSNATSFSHFVETNYDSDVPATQVATAEKQVCILNYENDIFCWGQYDYSITNDDLGQITELDSGDTHFCMTTSQQNLYCWGKNQHSAIGNGGSTSH